MKNKGEFHILLLIFKTVSSYNVSSVVFSYVFSMLSFGHILISNLVVVNLFMHTLPGVTLLYLAMPFLH